VPVTSWLAFLAAATCIAEGGIVVKRFPRADPFVANAIGMATGAVMLIAVSLGSGERLTVPSRGSTWAAIGTLVVLGGVVLFFLVLVVLRRWTASALSYAFVLFPIVAVLVSAVLEGTPVTPGVFVGTGIVAAGVYVGALAPERDRRELVGSEP
jgi:drug/metabolite transporter (DMT)-like permease